MEEVAAVIASQIITAAALGGVLWQRQASSEEHMAQRHQQIKRAVEDLTAQLRKQNGRIDRLEQWKRKREGFTEGYERAKDKYKDGHGPQPGVQG